MNGYQWAPANVSLTHDSSQEENEYTKQSSIFFYKDQMDDTVLRYMTVSHA